MCTDCGSPSPSRPGPVRSWALAEAASLKHPRDSFSPVFIPDPSGLTCRSDPHEKQPRRHRHVRVHSKGIWLPFWKRNALRGRGRLPARCYLPFPETFARRAAQRRRAALRAPWPAPFCGPPPPAVTRGAGLPPPPRDLARFSKACFQSLLVPPHQVTIFCGLRRIRLQAPPLPLPHVS